MEIMEACKREKLIAMLVVGHADGTMAFFFVSSLVSFVFLVGRTR